MEETPRWGKEANTAGPELNFADPIGVPAVVYDAGRKRYIAVVNTRSKFSIIAAPQPWGHWTSVATYPTWDGIKPPDPLTLTVTPLWIKIDGDSATALYRKGDTIYSVACYYGDVDPMAIAAVNGLSSPYTLNPGSMIQIP